ncbi:hypothetical protein Tco_0794091 [Tanacetum coccineum]
MTTLADKSLLSGGDNKPPMLEKHLYDSWKSRMELYMMNRPHGRMILASVEKGLPTEIYALVSQHRVAKDLWEKIKLLMQGTSLTKQEHEASCYDDSVQCSVFRKGDDPIDAINHMMSFLTVLSHRGRQTTYAAGKYTPSYVKHTGNKRYHLVIAMGGLYCKQSEEIAFLADQGLPDTQNFSAVITHNAAYQVDVLDASECLDALNEEQAVKQHRLESRTFEVKMNQVLSENERLLAQAIDHDIVKTIVNLSVNDGCETMNECTKSIRNSRLSFSTKRILLIKKLTINFTNSVLDQNAPSFTQLFELSEWRAQSQEKDTGLCKFKANYVLKKGLWTDSKEQGLVLAALKNELRKLKGKALDKEAIETYSVDPKVSPHNMEPITPKLLNKRTAHSSYIKHTQEETLVLKDIVEHVKANYPQDSLLESAFRCTKVIQDLLSHISRTCPSINNFDPKLVAVTPRKKDKKVKFVESLTSTENINTDSTSNIVSNKHVLHSTGVRLFASASGSQPSGNTRNDKIQQTPSSNSKNKVKVHSRNVKSSLNKRNGTVKVNGSASVQNSKKHDNYDYETIVLESESPKPVVNLVYSRKPRKNKNTESVSKNKVVQIVLWYLDSGFSKHMTGDRSQLTNFISKFLGTVKFRNDQVAKIIGYGDYQIGNVTISRVYYVEGLGHNLFSVGQFCDSNLEVAFR